MKDSRKLYGDVPTSDNADTLWELQKGKGHEARRQEGHGGLASGRDLWNKRPSSDLREVIGQEYEVKTSRLRWRGDEEEFCPPPLGPDKNRTKSRTFCGSNLHGVRVYERSLGSRFEHKVGAGNETFHTLPRRIVTPAFVNSLS
eukprot:768460-Hanusia_phi.AAC.5